ncbi:medium-chain acyl-CoA ligase ACSF2, mitochondrial-like [Gigantopelta aegis]|uniref:medium-chain acyl-CoA ligase ACSF2, mitochondrial-like n=1 Tax=Gigantopelta aegis TaxID=1735272 RepID=UPI001B88A328|nr:medium-chain acyl-CoA ligase ACSF2, mitochondrial-like [Gigantopelta aegis]
MVVVSSSMWNIPARRFLQLREPFWSLSCCICVTAKRLNQSVRYRYHSTAASKLQWSYASGPSDKPLLGKTIGQCLQERVEKTPDKEAVVFYSQGFRKTFSQLLNEVDQLAAGFMSLGLKKGDRVGMWGPNSLEWILTQYATARAGLILININPAYRPAELEYTLKKVGMKALVAAPGYRDLDYYEMMFGLVPELATSHPGNVSSHLLPELKFLIMLGQEKYRGAFLFSDVMEAGTTENRKAILDLQNKIQFDDPVNIQFTSGTTGTPKGATLSHHNVVNNSYFVGQRLDYHNMESRICMPVPLYHTFGCVLGSMQIIHYAVTCIFPSESFEPETCLKVVQDERCTALYGVPTMFIDMLNHPSFNKYNLSSLYTGIMAGSPCPREVMKDVNNKMHMKGVTVCYGTTETSPVTFQTYHYSPVEKRITTIGLPLDHTEAKIVDEKYEVVPVGVSGEICTRGFSTFLGYWKDQDKTNEVITRDRWYHTGDIGVFDEEGYCRIVGRIKDLIIRGGVNISPKEIEELLYKYPKVVDVQVIGVPDARTGEEVCAWIKLKDNTTATEDEIKDYCKQNLARFKVPRYILFMDEFPLTVSGKVQKFIMREQTTKILNLEHIHPH